jgi:phosphoribosyl 1,2-cyclic phosphodiesterase
MALQICSINSGSNGNCYYVGNTTDAILIDAGISCKETELRMHQNGLSMQTVKAIFISHEHIDHIKGIATLANKYDLPVYITDATSKHAPKSIQPLIKTFKANEPVAVQELKITPFAKQHDADDPHSFIVNYNGITVGVFTDIGIVCNQLTHYFKQCHAAFLESNYDEVLLENGRYPAHLKKRIRGGQGHLSNKQAVELFKTHRPPFMTHLLLSHLSQENNTPQLAEAAFTPHANGTNIIVASRHQASEVFTISSSQLNEVTVAKVYKKPTQLTIF